MLLAPLSLVAIAAVAFAAAIPARAEAIPAAIEAELTNDGPATRLAITLSQPVAARTLLMERPDRVVVDLPEVNFQLPANAARTGKGIVASVRTGLFAPGRSRIVIDLSQPAAVSKLEVTSRASDGASILTIELTRIERDAFRRLAQAQERPPVSGGPDQLAAVSDPRPLIVIDPGHGGVDPGATAPGGTLEKDIVFGFAQRLPDHAANVIFAQRRGVEAVAHAGAP